MNFECRMMNRPESAVIDRRYRRRLANTLAPPSLPSCTSRSSREIDLFGGLRRTGFVLTINSMPNAKAFAAQNQTSPLGPFSIQRRDPGPRDVEMKILFCGVCHTDLHIARNDWGGSVYPVVPGHEIVGRVTRVGKEVKKYKEGDTVAVGCMVDSCRQCENCKAGDEQFCDNGTTFTYNAPDKVSGGMTYGGYSESVVVDQD